MAPSQFSFDFEVMSKQSKKFQLTSAEPSRLHIKQQLITITVL